MNEKKKFVLIFSVAIIVFSILSSIVGPTPIITNNPMKIAVFHLIKGGGMYLIVFSVFFIPYLVINHFTKEKKDVIAIANTIVKLSIIINVLMFLLVLYGRRKL